MGEGTYCANFSPDMEFVDNLRESSIVSSLIGKTCKESFEGSTASMIILQYTIFNIVIFLIIHGTQKSVQRSMQYYLTTEIMPGGYDMLKRV